MFAARGASALVLGPFSHLAHKPAAAPPAHVICSPVSCGVGDTVPIVLSMSTAHCASPPPPSPLPRNPSHPPFCPAWSSAKESWCPGERGPRRRGSAGLARRRAPGPSLGDGKPAHDSTVGPQVVSTGSRCSERRVCVMGRGWGRGPQTREIPGDRRASAGPPDLTVTEDPEASPPPPPGAAPAPPALPAGPQRRGVGAPDLRWPRLRPGSSQQPPARGSGRPSGSAGGRGPGVPPTALPARAPWGRGVSTHRPSSTAAQPWHRVPRAPRRPSTSGLPRVREAGPASPKAPPMRPRAARSVRGRDCPTSDPARRHQGVGPMRGPGEENSGSPGTPITWRAGPHQ